MSDCRYFRIVFADRAYYPGTPVIGKVELGVSKELQVDAVTLSIKGLAQVKWTSGNTHYHGKHTYIDDKSAICPSRRLMPAEDYVWAFGFVLPLGIPGSAVTEHGKITYHAEAVAHKSALLSINLRATSFIKVSPMIDCNLPQYLSPLTFNAESNIACCWPSGSMSLELFVERQAFTPLESIPFRVKIANHSAKALKLCVKLVQRVTNRVKYTEKCTNKRMACLSNSTVEPGAEEERRLSVMVPQTEVTNTQALVLKLHYLLVVTLDSPNSCMKIIKECPIVIGTVPYRATGEDTTAPVVATAQPMPNQSGDADTGSNTDEEPPKVGEWLRYLE